MYIYIYIEREREIHIYIYIHNSIGEVRVPNRQLRGAPLPQEGVHGLYIDMCIYIYMR